ncbi:hypothetical protein BT69DRAFT_1355852 [Atractiella rhizophila]|nr:hypothetical protein BT69DRAFT_1355852 [Atractiella rhizophila]
MGLFRKNTTNTTTNNSRGAPPATRDAGRTSTSSTTRSGSMFGRRSNSPRNSADSFSHTDNLRKHDRTIGGAQPITSQALSDARNGLNRAVQAERDAQAALERSKVSLREAKQHVTKLEEEANREAKLAQAKLKEASGMKKVTRGMGR